MPRSGHDAMCSDETVDTFRYDRDCIVILEGFEGKESSKSVVKGDFIRSIEEGVPEGPEVCW